MEDVEYVQVQVGDKKYPKIKIRNRDTCLRCGRKLINPESKKRGMGSACYRNTVIYTNCMVKT